MRVGDLPGPCVYCSSQTFGKRDQHIGNSCLSSLLLLPLPAASPSPSRWRRSAVCSSFLHVCVWLFLFCRLLYVALRAALLRAFGRYPVLFFVFVPRWQPRHQRRRASFFFGNRPCYLRLRCSYPFRRFPDDPSGQQASAAVVTDLITIKRTMLGHPRLISRRWLLYLAQAAAPAAPRFA